MKFRIVLSIFLVTGLHAFSQTQLTDATFGAIEGRQIGPATTSGRIAAIDAELKNPNMVWVGAAGGGVWKSKNYGTTFKSVFDDQSQSIGAICIDQKYPDTVWVGTGEPWVRNSTSIGTGIYRTTNGGEKWELMGLEKSERIAKIIIDPNNSNTVYVAVLGALWSDSEDRGIYKTTDGGKTWNKILYVNPSTGCSSIAMDPQHPEILYAGMWDFRRTAYDFRSGGPGCGLYKSTDAGKTWNKIQNGLPADSLGRICVTISPVAPYDIYALVESAKSALYKSNDGGANWKQMSTQSEMGERPFYFCYIVPDPVDANRIYKPGFNLLVSNNGGGIFQGAAVEGGGYHGDLHALWISPKDNNLLYLGTDGGVYISRDKGNTWSHCENLPVAQFYHVSYDMQKPYNVYGGLQDNGSWKGPSRSTGGIQNSDWKTIGYGDGFNAYADLGDENIVYWQYQGGRIYRSNLKTGESKFIKPFADQSTEDLRYNWNTPVVFGKKTKWLYVGSQYLFRSKDKGDSWERISPDLTTDDPNRQKQEQSGGVTTDNTSAENNTTIFSISESMLDENIIWAGTDDGNVQVTADGGKTWSKLNANIPGLPALAFISSVEADNFNKNAAYITVDGHRNGDMKSYVFYTNDLGKTWKSITTENIKGYCHVIRQDIVNADLLFLGTEFGLYVSIDKGNTWVQFKSKIPQVGVFDIAIQPRENDLLLATHGRGIIIIDDITPIRNIKSDILEKDLAFLPTRPYYFTSGGIAQDFPGDDEFIGANPNGAATIVYYMKKRHVFGEMYMEIYNAKGEMIRKQPAGNRKGINIVSLQTSMKPPVVPSSPNPLFEAAFGPSLEAGDYTIKIIKGEETYSTKITLQNNPDVKHSAEDRKLQHEKLMAAYDLIQDLAYIDKQIIEIRDHANSLKDSIKIKALKAKAETIAKQMDDMHHEISATQPGEGGVAAQVRLREKIAEVYSAIGGYDGKPTSAQIAALDLYTKQVAEMQARLDAMKAGDFAAFEKAISKSGHKPLVFTTKEELLKD